MRLADEALVFARSKLGLRPKVNVAALSQAPSVAMDSGLRQKDERLSAL